MIKAFGYLGVLIGLLLWVFYDGSSAEEKQQKQLEEHLRPITEQFKKSGFIMQSPVIYDSMPTCRAYIDDQVELASAKQTPAYSLKNHMKNKDIYAYFIGEVETQQGQGIYCIPWKNKAVFIEGELKLEE